MSFDEVGAATAALTKGGISTAESVTGLRAAMSAVLGPSEAAQKLAKQLGIEFNVAGLKSKGFAGFMEGVIAKTGGSEEALQKLFSSIEATGIAMAFSGSAGRFLAENLELMGKKAGATDVAFGKLSKGMDERLNVAMGRLGVHAINFGNALLTAGVPAMEAFASAMDIMADNSDVLMSVMTGMIATQIPGMIAGIGSLSKILTLATGAARALSVAVAIAGGPFGILAGIVAATAGYFLLFREEAEKVPTPIEESKKALDALNLAMGKFSTDYAPSAATEALTAANAYVALADSIHNTAIEQVALMRTELGILAAQKVAGTNFFADRQAELMADDMKEAVQELARAELALEVARSRRIRTAKHIMASDGAMAKAQKELNSTIEVTVKGVANLGGALTKT